LPNIQRRLPHGSYIACKGKTSLGAIIFWCSQIKPNVWNAHILMRHVTLYFRNGWMLLWQPWHHFPNVILKWLLFAHQTQHRW
jgi:hypothetical protein